MNTLNKLRFKNSLQKVIGRQITDGELDALISAYLRSSKVGEERLLESISEATQLENFSVNIKFAAAASDDTERVKNDLRKLLDDGK